MRFLTIDELNMLMDRRRQQQQLLKIQQFLLSAFGIRHALVHLQGRSHPAGERFDWLLLDRITVTNKAGEAFTPNYTLPAWVDCPAIDWLLEPGSNPRGEATEPENENYPAEESTNYIEMSWLGELWQKIVGDIPYYADETFDLTSSESQKLLAWSMPRLLIDAGILQDQQPQETNLVLVRWKSQSDVVPGTEFPEQKQEQRLYLVVLTWDDRVKTVFLCAATTEAEAMASVEAWATAQWQYQAGIDETVVYPLGDSIEPIHLFTASPDGMQVKADQIEAEEAQAKGKGDVAGGELLKQQSAEEVEQPDGRPDPFLMGSLTAVWSPDTRVRERPLRDVTWETSLLNGDIQVIFEPEDLDIPLSTLYHLVNQPLPFSYYQMQWTDPRTSYPQNYYMAMWNEGAWAPMKQALYDFDVLRSIEGFERIEEEEGNADHLCGLWRKEGMDQRPLFQRGYTSASLSHEKWLQEKDGLLTREWMRGDHAGQDDAWLKDGYVNTGRKCDSCMESIERVKWLL